MKKLLKKVMKPFLPTYEVVCTNYHVIPGHPINGNQSKHKFEKGASEDARKFYVKVVNSDLTKTMAPMEVHLKKRGRIIEKSEFGPVNELKKFKIVYKG
ncbi:hypothetical protein FVR03_12435 [Pontibacter qinzhouensis]|uniref:Uncharacterized protein n=1 Tax=Pontibacter qinzhouensis TaxID=2603253 RepID=A0A5C8K6R6_9BACT|nr:hypothetical protein [Pontibacter qinzhouensis]TXK45339.1 hypothetical protein FVR03_12435 [Pontibacter qinzhouensis]